ncbi:MAG: MmcQ/YjbR family DNA-binding protein [Pseudomonadota bacterium]
MAAESKLRTLHQAIENACLALPETSVSEGHGMPNYKVRGKVFATWSLNHHGDGIAALWLKLPGDSRDSCLLSDPEDYFVPPYVGPRGWLGMRLNEVPEAGLTWRSVCARIYEAYRHMAPAGLAASVDGLADIAPPTRAMLPEEIDPWLAPAARALLAAVADLTSQWPEVTETRHFGAPAFKAGKKTFCTVHWRSPPSINFWVGADQQVLLTLDPRFRIPAYTGVNGWIAHDLADPTDLGGVETLLLDSYRHFALKRMLKALDGAS